MYTNPLGDADGAWMEIRNGVMASRELAIIGHYPEKVFDSGDKPSIAEFELGVPQRHLRLEPDGRAELGWGEHVRSISG